MESSTTQRIMVCVRKGIPASKRSHAIYKAKKEDAFHVEIYEGDVCVAKGSLIDADHFGTSRKMLQVDEIKEANEELYQFLIAHLAFMHDDMMSRYPSYIVLNEDQIDETAWLAHLGFTPFLGEFKESSQENSQAQWEIATQKLRERG
jgi:hypothetical protein